MILQLLAMLTMLIDHIGIAFFPDDNRFRIAGRLSFPLYAYALVMGYGRTRSVPRYLLRLFVIAVISQLPYQWALDGEDINVVGSLLVCLLVLWVMGRCRNPAVSVPVIAAASALLELFSFNYGFYALALVLIYHYAKSHAAFALHLALNVIFIFYKGWVTQMFSIAATIILYYMPQLLYAIDRIRIPRLLWRAFYPVHLAAIGAARYLG